MDDVAVAELRQNLGVYLHRVARGETPRVADHGRPVAVLTPIRTAADDTLDRLEAEGLSLASPRGKSA